jgi:hypothetical protein
VTARLLIPAVRAAYGVLLLSAPGPVLSWCGAAVSPRTRAVVRVLGVRHLAQAAVTAGAPRPRVLAAGAGVDLCHAASMLALAAADPALRRAALTDASAATALAIAGAATARPEPAAQLGSSA